MKVGDLVKIPDWQFKRTPWHGYSHLGVGIIFEITPYAVHVRWSSGDVMAHKTKTHFRQFFFISEVRVRITLMEP